MSRASPTERRKHSERFAHKTKTISELIKLITEYWYDGNNRGKFKRSLHNPSIYSQYFRKNSAFLLHLLEK